MESITVRSAKDNQVLRQGTNFLGWRTRLKGALAKKDVLGLVFHDLGWEEPIREPQPADYTTTGAYQAAVRDFKKKDLIAYSVILSRIEESLAPNFGSTEKSAKELYDSIASIYQPVVTVDIYDTLKQIGNIKLTANNTLKYCKDFQKWLHNHRTATKEYARSLELPTEKEQEITFHNTLINMLFVMGLNHVEWLRSWRHVNKPEKVTLEEMITSLRKEKPPQGQQTPWRRTAVGAMSDSKADEQCTQCKHEHTNANCYRQHPELAPDSWKKRHKDSSKKGMAGALSTSSHEEPTYNYTPNHKRSHIANHTWRTAENSAAYLIPTIQSMAPKKPDLKLLDCGAGPGTLTASFSKYMPEGTLIATDLSEEVIDQAREHAKSQCINNMTCQTADIYHLDQTFPDGEFDIVHTHQTLCHLSHPLLAMRSLLRVCKSGGVIAIRESDMRMWSFHPSTPGLEKFHKLVMRCMDSPNIGSRLVGLAMEAGVPRSSITASMGTWCYSTPEERQIFGGAMAARARSGKQREKPVQDGWYSYAEMDEMVQAWEDWIKASDGSYGSMHGEIIIQKP